LNLQAIIEKYLSRLPEGIASKIFNSIKDIPFIQKEIQKEIDKMMAEMESSVKPYKGKVESFPKILPHHESCFMNESCFPSAG